MKRSEAREKVFKIVFQIEFYDSFEEMVPKLVSQEGLHGTQGEYAMDTLFGILRKKEEIDGIISDNLKNWTLPRLSKQALALLRLGVYEIIYNDSIPDVSAIDEAVKLSYIYCDEKDSTFINGVLNQVYQAKAK
ncbi:MAG: transcription antitermination factor NusB [Eubacteriaceae bacterium]|nr:transcription antitermination factor NusB [Eubacteriaceae bacterium]